MYRVRVVPAIDRFLALGFLLAAPGTQARADADPLPKLERGPSEARHCHLH
jgi:hypothetical protein